MLKQAFRVMQSITIELLYARDIFCILYKNRKGFQYNLLNPFPVLYLILFYELSVTVLPVAAIIVVAVHPGYLPCRLYCSYV